MRAALQRSPTCQIVPATSHAVTRSMFDLFFALTIQPARQRPHSPTGKLPHAQVSLELALILQLGSASFLIRDLPLVRCRESGLQRRKSAGVEGVFVETLRFLLPSLDTVPLAVRLLANCSLNPRSPAVAPLLGLFPATSHRSSHSLAPIS